MELSESLGFKWVVWFYEGPSDKEFVFGAQIMLHIKARVERGNYMDDVF